MINSLTDSFGHITEDFGHYIRLSNDAAEST
jgi:hypothetical protein